MRTRPDHGDTQAAPPDLRDAWARLEKSGWLARRSQFVRELLKPNARLRRFAAGDALYLAGDVPNGVFGLLEGALEIAVPGMDGAECLLHRAEPGFWVGDLALFAGQRRLVTIRAASACTTVHLPQEALSACTEQYPQLSRDFYELSHENMHTVLQLLGNLTIQSAESRIALRLLMYAKTQHEADDWIRISSDALAQLVAVSPKTVRRTLSHLEKLGLVETAYARIRVADYAALAGRCGHGLVD